MTVKVLHVKQVWCCSHLTLYKNANQLLYKNLTKRITGRAQAKKSSNNGKRPRWFGPLSNHSLKSRAYQKKPSNKAYKQSFTKRKKKVKQGQATKTIHQTESRRQKNSNSEVQVGNNYKNITVFTGKKKKKNVQGANTASTRIQVTLVASLRPLQCHECCFLPKECRLAPRGVR